MKILEDIVSENHAVATNRKNLARYLLLDTAYARKI